MASGAFARVIAGALLTGCVEPPVPPEEQAAPVVTFEPDRVGLVQPVVRVRIERESGNDRSLGELFLGKGVLSETQLRRLQDDELPKTLMERRVPLVAWQATSGSVTYAQPEVRLTAGEVYTLASSAFGRLATFSVDPDTARPTLERLWPPPGSTSAGGYAVYCGAELPVGGTVVLDPGRVSASFEPDYGTYEGRRCALVAFERSAVEGRTLVLPPEIEGMMVDPEPLVVGPRDPTPAFADCGDAEIELGPGCAVVEDDRLVVRNGARPLLWRVVTERSVQLAAPAPGGRFLISGLLPECEIDVSGEVFTTDGARTTFSARVTTGAPRNRLVLNEVLANPIGAEPAGEWVELFNAGSAEVDLAGMQLSDAAGTVELPSARVPAGGYALIVREDFTPGAYDVAPAPETLLVRVPQIGKNGLSNAGEPLVLSAADGTTVSRFPALPARTAGVAMARAHPDALDDDLSAFREHAPPGASPGAPNEVVAARAR